MLAKEMRGSDGGTLATPEWALGVAASIGGRRPIGGIQNEKPATDFSVRALQILR